MTRVLIALTALLLAATLLAVSPASAQDRTNPGVRAQESCKVDAAYNVLLNRIPDRTGHNYWLSVLRQRFANGNQIIQWHIPANREYILVSNDVTRIEFIFRMLEWSRGDVDGRTAHWYMGQRMTRPEMLAYETSYHGRCHTARRTGRYTPLVQI